MSKNDPTQYLLDFTSHADERRRRLRAALKLTSGADLRQWSFLLWIFNIENETSGLVKDYNEIAETLWCDRATAVRMVKRLEEVGLLEVKSTFTADGDRSKNSYRIGWEAVDRKLRGDIEKKYGVKISGSQNATTTSHGATTPSHGATSNKETDLSGILLKSPEPGVPIAEPRMARRSRDDDQLRSAIFEELSELRDTRHRELSPLPASELVYGAFKELSREHLDNIELLLLWQRRQLSLLPPICGPTIADFLLTMSAAIFAKTMDHRDVKKTRVAVFISLISRRKWDKVRCHVPRAARAFAEWETRSPLGIDFTEAAWMQHRTS